jgi:dihydrofolate synthase/folylpolyglutamate synthase
LPQHPEANQAIGEVAAELGIHAINAAAYIPPADKLLSQSAKIDPSTPAPIQQRVLPSDPEQLRTSFASKVHWLPRNRYILTLGNQPLHVDSPLWGQHQQRNIALAIAAAQELSNPTSYNLRKSNQVSYNITNSEIEAGIRNTRWPGRLEIVTFSSIPPGPMARQRVVPTDAEVSGRQRNEKTGLSTSDADPAPVFPPVLLDVAHNPAGAWTLRAALAQFPEDLPRTLIFSCLRDKDLREMSQILLPLFDSSSPDRPHDHILFAPINSPRAVSLDDLVKTARELEIPAETAPTLAEALNRAWAVTPPHGLIVATGSVYLVGELRTLLRKA